MRIILIRHGKVNMAWQKKYTSREYDQAWAEYDKRDILPIQTHLDLPESIRVYCTNMKRTQQTAEQFLRRKNYEIIESLANEIPLRSFRDLNHRHSRRLMNFVGRLQWYFPTKRQPENRAASYKRAIKLIEYLENGVDDAVVVMHGFFLRTVCRALKHDGYKLDHQPFFGVPNLTVVNAVKDEEKVS
ncbi:MAG: histidine phosphatase family protein [Lachnospiraceae bacterium]|nr:histidine phosphatase family protein [Lachnospiraceae bacterium]